VGHEDTCCPHQVCVPIGGNCPTPKPMSCGQLQQAVTFMGNDGCPRSVCECSDQCPTQLPDLPPLQPGQELVPSSGCCNSATILCHSDRCPPSPDCPSPLELHQEVGPCCPQFSCVAPPQTCLYTMTEGEEAGKMVTKAVDETWTDGDCKTCKCEAPDSIMMDLMVSLGMEPRGPEPSCTLQGCQDGSLAREEGKYVVEEVIVSGLCCPQYKRVACRDSEGKERAVGEQWRIEQCITESCVRGANGEVEVEVDKETCMTDCPAGSTYTEVAWQCCGKCSPVPDCTTVQGEGGAVGKLRVQVPGHGTCSNSVPISDWAECLGNCRTGTYYSSASGEQEVNCTCCQPRDQRVVSVELACPDGHSSQWSVVVPSSCTCTACKHEEKSAALTLLENPGQSPALVGEPERASLTGPISEEDIFGEFL